MPTLIDGREVASDSQEWQMETLARWVMKLQPAAKQADWLAEFGRKQPRVMQQLEPVLVKLLDRA